MLPPPNLSKLRRVVAFENWSGKNRDVLRLKRLLVTSSVGFFALMGVFIYLMKTAPKALADEPEEDAKVVEVELAQAEPEPEPPPPPPELQPHRSNPGPRLQKIETPTTISDDKIPEKDVKPSATGGGDPYEKGSGDGTGGAQRAVVEAPAPAAPAPAPLLPKVKKPVPVPENGTPPEATVKLVKPEYPADAKAAGLEGTVVVRYVVTETGDVTDVRAMKGPPELFAVCVAAVKAMRFKPALDGDGKPLMVVRYMKFPFRLRT